MFRKIFNSLSPMEQFSLTLLFYALSVFMVTIGITLGLKFITYTDDFYNLIGFLLVVISTILGFVLGVSISKREFFKGDEEDKEK